MLKRLRTAHPILYCILAEVLFLGSLFLSSLVLTVALVAAAAAAFGTVCWWGCTRWHSSATAYTAH